jgi:hypothetical protein
MRDQGEQGGGDFDERQPTPTERRDWEYVQHVPRFDYAYVAAMTGQSRKLP